MDDVVTRAAELLLSAGWRGALVAVALVVLYVIARKGLSSLPKPTYVPPEKPRQPDVSGDMPDAEWGDNVRHIDGVTDEIRGG